MRHRNAKIILATVAITGVVGAGVAVAADAPTCPYGNTPEGGAERGRPGNDNGTQLPLRERDGTAHGTPSAAPATALAMASGSTRAEVTAARTRPCRGVEVADTARGAPSERTRVFDRGAAAAGASGQGVGLAVVAEIVEAHGGRVDVTDNNGAGARFIVALPID